MENNLTNIIVLSEGKTDSLALKHSEEEFSMLLKEIGYKPIMFFSQDIDDIDKNTYLGKGKIKEIRGFYQAFCIEKEICEDVKFIACNFDLTSLQKKNIEEMTGFEVIDRTFVILEIFNKNAKTKEAKLQVEIARLNYLKSHLVNEKASYSQVTSGGGHNKGEGEKQIELTRRQIAKSVHQKKMELDAIKLSRKNSRQQRINSSLPKICIVGYTNAGKSTLMNRLLKMSHANENKNVLQKDALFATLETSSRLISIHKFLDFILTDTVGFIRNLPIYLVDAFRSTLEEITEADLLVHVIDASDPFLEEQMQTTNEILCDLGADDIPMIYLINKIDLVKTNAYEFAYENSLIVSLKDDGDCYEIMKFISSNLSRGWEKHTLLVPYEIDFNKFSSENYVMFYIEKENGIECTAYMNPKYLYKYLIYFK